MLMTEIRKQSFGVVDQVSAVLNDLAEQAKEILGYDILAQRVMAPSVELTALQQALKDLEVDVLRREDVALYQKERLVEHTRERLAAWEKETTAKDELGRWDNFSGPAWVETKIAEYKQPVPEFVLAKAVQIKQRVPECEIYVQSLEDHPDPFLVVAIPDERAYYPDKERYWVEVWEEPKFEGRLRAGTGSGAEGDVDIPF